MAILSEYEQEDQKKPSSSATSTMKQFNAFLDPSDPLGFLEKVFEFVAKESDSLVNVVNAVVRMVKDKVEAEDKKRKEVKTEANGKEEKKIKEEMAPSRVKQEELKSEKVKEEKQSGSQVEEKSGRRDPNKGNGLDIENYSWGQSLQMVKVSVPVPPGTRADSVAWEIKKSHLKVGLKGHPPVIDAELFRPVEVGVCFWNVEDQKRISVFLTKQNQTELWKYLLKGDLEVDTQKLEPENSKLSDLDPEMRSTVEKTMFDQRHKQMDLSISDKMQNKGY